MVATWKGEKFLGEVESEIVGLQYYEATVEPGDSVNLEREPDNPHDPNAIRVESRDFVPVGHLPRKVASWLALLMDKGEVRVDALVASTPPPFRTRAPLTLKLLLCPKGEHILKRRRKPTTELEALHEVIRRTYVDVESYKNADVIRLLGEKLDALGTSDVLPETRLLLALFPDRAGLVRERRLERLGEMFKEEMTNVTAGKALYHHNITVFPLIGPARKAAYILLDEAVKKDLALVEEVTEEGEVPNLRVVNNADKPLMIVEGEVLRGAKQDRVVNVTVIVGAGAALALPVSCVERGRWNYVSRHFRPERFMPPSLRAAALQDIRQNLSHERACQPDQSRIWQGVDSLLADVGAESDTETVADAFKASRKRLKEYRSHIKLPGEARGFLVARGDSLVGVDLFNSPTTMRKMWGRLSEAYFLEAIRAPAEKPPTRKTLAKEWLRNLAENLKSTEGHIGDGLRMSIEAEDLVGSAVWLGEELCHLSAFCVREGNESPPAQPLRA